MHRTPWWKTWGCMGLLSVVVWGETGCVTVAWRILSTYTDTVRERDDVSPLLACVAISLWPQTTVSEVYPSMWLWWEWDPQYWVL